MCSDKTYYVYRHKNKINNKSYIGITCQQPEKRWANGEGYKHQPFYEAIQKYGWNNFEHIILEQGLTKEQATRRERFYIKCFNSFKNGYNFSEGGESGFDGGHHSEETKKNISENMKKFIKENDKDRGKRLYQILRSDPTINEKRIEHINNIFKPGSEAAKKRTEKNKKRVKCVELNKFFNSVKEAADFAQISDTGISHCLHGKQKTAGGYHWIYIID